MRDVLAIMVLLLLNAMLWSWVLKFPKVTAFFGISWLIVTLVYYRIYLFC